MTPKEKAKELFEKIYNEIQPDELGKDQESAKQCALIAVDEILSVPYLLKYETWFYKEVKQEIEKLW